mmetsp:Transcript_4861/g.22270  ORF Transcript_4861/g.22270 Transcript_4861/m.22270 type:complete len:316 (+) Transcript_4861:3327-4274(+)
MLSNSARTLATSSTALLKALLASLASSDLSRATLRASSKSFSLRLSSSPTGVDGPGNSHDSSSTTTPFSSSPAAAAFSLRTSLAFAAASVATTARSLASTAASAAESLSNAASVAFTEASFAPRRAWSTNSALLPLISPRSAAELDGDSSVSTASARASSLCLSSAVEPAVASTATEASSPVFHTLSTWNLSHGGSGTRSRNGTASPSSSLASRTARMESLEGSRSSSSSSSSESPTAQRLVQDHHSSLFFSPSSSFEPRPVASRVSTETDEPRAPLSPSSASIRSSDTLPTVLGRVRRFPLVRYDRTLPRLEPS